MILYVKKIIIPILLQINSKNKNQEAIKLVAVAEQKLEEALWRNKER